MTLGESLSCSCSPTQMEGASEALLELLSAAQHQNCLSIGVYEAAKLLNLNPDCVVLCVLAADAEHESDVALQIHFTLLQAFCHETQIDAVRVRGMRRLAEAIGEPMEDGKEPKDLHCILVTNPQVEHRKLNEVGRYCRESRCENQWLPHIDLHQRQQTL